VLQSLFNRTRRSASAAETWSFSQCGEDRIARWILGILGVDRTRYLDIGAYHPCQLSNTYLFYRLGGSGVLVEPNPRWTRLIRRERPRDTCLGVGLGALPRAGVPFHVMKSDTLCTFSRAESDRMVAECGEEILETRPIDVVTPARVQAEHFRDGLNFVSLDVEGLELEILQAFDFDANRPEVFCIETLSYAIDGTGRKDHRLIDWMASRGYAVHADTYVNTIFVDEDRARNRLLPGGSGMRHPYRGTPR
jgi:FkbM family methyltransferase